MILTFLWKNVLIFDRLKIYVYQDLGIVAGSSKNKRSGWRPWQLWDDQSLRVNDLDRCQWLEQRVDPDFTIGADRQKRVHVKRRKLETTITIFCFENKNFFSFKITIVKFWKHFSPKIYLLLITCYSILIATWLVVLKVLNLSLIRKIWYPKWRVVNWIVPKHMLKVQFNIFKSRHNLFLKSFNWFWFISWITIKEIPFYVDSILSFIAIWSFKNMKRFSP